MLSWHLTTLAACAQTISAVKGATAHRCGPTTTWQTQGQMLHKYSENEWTNGWASERVQISQRINTWAEIKNDIEESREPIHWAQQTNGLCFGIRRHQTFQCSRSWASFFLSLPSLASSPFQTNAAPAAGRTVLLCLDSEPPWAHSCTVQDEAWSCQEAKASEETLPSTPSKHVLDQRTQAPASVWGPGPPTRFSVPVKQHPHPNTLH